MRKFMVILAAVSFSGISFSQSFLNVGTGSSTGTYHQMFSDLGKVCGSTSWLKEKGSSGSVENIQLLLDNEVSLGFVQLDVLVAQKTVFADDRVDNIKVLLPLHKEELHILVKSNSSIKKFSDLIPKKGTLGFGNKTYKVGSWGGSSITAQVLRAKTKVQYDFVDYPDQKSTLEALKSGQIDALFAVGGQPLPWMKGLSGFKLVEFDQVSKVSDLYSKSRVSYAGLGGVNTISVQSVLAVRDFKTTEKKSQLLNYKKCAVSKLSILQETEGFHPKWNSVDFGKFDGWSVYK